jgi:hypothetical protein
VYEGKIIMISTEPGNENIAIFLPGNENIAIFLKSGVQYMRRD